MSIILASCGAGQTSGSSAIPEDKAVENKVESVLKKMTLEEKDRTPAYIAPDDLKEKYFRPFKDCMQAGALTMMIDCTETKVWDTPDID